MPRLSHSSARSSKPSALSPHGLLGCEAAASRSPDWAARSREAQCQLVLWAAAGSPGEPCLPRGLEVPDSFPVPCFALHLSELLTFEHLVGDLSES